MKSIKTKSLISAILLSTIIIIAVNSTYGWLVIHGSEAEDFAEHLLSEADSPYSEWSIDMVVVKKENIVTFSKHHSEIIYAYSPINEPQSTNIKWSHAWGKWYIGTIKT